MNIGSSIDSDLGIGWLKDDSVFGHRCCCKGVSQPLGSLIIV
jgi:hypothetical protein